MITILHIKTDTKVRSQVEKLAKHNGITMTALVNLSLRHLINNPVIELDLAPQPNARTKKTIAMVRKDLKTGRNISGPFNSVNALKKHLSA